MKRLGSLALALSTLGAFPALAQTAIQPGSIVGTFGTHNYIPASPLFTVPGDRAARATDLMASNYNATEICYAAVFFGGNPLYFIVGPRQNYSVSLGTGYGMTSGQTISLGSTGGTCTSTYVIIRGFYFTIP